MIKQTMKAVVLEQFGGTGHLSLQDVPVPQPAEGEVLVRVKAIGINPVDCKTRMGKGAASSLQLPAILGWDIAGEVVAAGSGTMKFKTGDHIFGMSRFPRQAAAYAEYAVVLESEFAMIPPALSFEEAAALPLAGLTAWQGLFEEIDIREGERLLVHAAAGGVGHIAVQLAKAKGAYVIGTASSDNHDFLKQLGIDECIDYRRQDFEDQLSQPVDAVFDGMGGETGRRSLSVIRKGGRLLSLPSRFRDDPEMLRLAGEKDIQVKWFLVHPDGGNMQSLADMAGEGKLSVEVAATFPLEKMAQAHRQIETGHTRGKIVVVNN